MNRKNPWEDIPLNRQFLCKESNKYNFWRYKKATKNGYNFSFLFELNTAKDDIPPSNKLPKFKQISFSKEQEKGSDKTYLNIQLLDNSKWDIFNDFVLLLIDACEKEKNEKDSLRLFIQRSYRWLALMKGGLKKRLSDEAQKGLIGELYFLKNTLFQIIGIRDSLDSWKGPIPQPKDFYLNKLQVEVKSIKRDGTSVSISSENQLELISQDELFLSVFGISSNKNGKTLTDWCHELEDLITNNDLADLEKYNELLLDAGFEFKDDYSDKKWEIEEISYYSVTKEFPRIVKSEISAGISKVEYLLDLSYIKGFKITYELLLDKIKKSMN